LPIAKEQANDAFSQQQKSFNCTFVPEIGQEMAKFRAAGYNKIKHFSHPDRFQPNSVLLDIGSFVGVDIAKFMESGRVDITIHTFEPVRTIFEKLQKNMRPFENVHVHFYGISNEDSSTCFAGDGDATRMVPVDSPDCSEKGELRDIATVLNEYESVDFLHMNCEGCEYPVLKRLLTMKTAAVRSIEFQHHMEVVDAGKYCELEELLVLCGYTLLYRYQGVWEHWRQL